MHAINAQRELKFVIKMNIQILNTLRLIKSCVVCCRLGICNKLIENIKMYCSVYVPVLHLTPNLWDIVLHFDKVLRVCKWEENLSKISFSHVTKRSFKDVSGMWSHKKMLNGALGASLVEISFKMKSCDDDVCKHTLNHRNGRILIYRHCQ